MVVKAEMEAESEVGAKVKLKLEVEVKVQAEVQVKTEGSRGEKSLKLVFFLFFGGRYCPARNWMFCSCCALLLCCVFAGQSKKLKGEK